MEHFLKTFNSIDADNLDLLGKIYNENVVFTDPAHRIVGLDNLKDYFAAMYSNVKEINFTFSEILQNNDKGYVQWEMEFSHPSLASGKIITVPGTSYLEFDNEGKVKFHRDYFDLGSMLYENIPLIGRIILVIKGRLSK